MIYLDQDGVTLDFEGSILKLCDIDPNNDEVRKKVINEGIYSLIPKNKLWKKITKEGVNFWANLEPAGYFDELLDFCLTLTDHVYFLSSPSFNAESLYGKQLSLQRIFDDNKFDKYVFTRHKYLLACDGTLLIDDKEKQTIPFIEFGGEALLWPHLFKVEDDRVLFDNLLNQIRETYEKAQSNEQD